MGDSASWAECNFEGRRYPFTSACTESKETRGRYGIYLNEGKRYADVVWTSDRVESEDGKEALAIDTLWNGYTMLGL